MLTDIDINNITDEIIKKVLFSKTKSEYDSADVLIIFGAHIKPLLDERINHAINILKSKKINKIILTGGVGVNGDFNEALYMRDKLLEEGILDSKIIIEDKSTTTEENIINTIDILKSNDLIEEKKIVLVSSEAHLRRIGMELKKNLKDNNYERIYEYPDISLISYEKVINDDELKMMAVNEIKKIISFINKGIIDDEEICYKEKVI